jgi:hypothetical protein
VGEFEHVAAQYVALVLRPDQLNRRRVGVTYDAADLNDNRLGRLLYHATQPGFVNMTVRKPVALDEQAKQQWLTAINRVSGGGAAPAR